ncbi:hypothetical protein Cadr_000009971 [Camelus dromedarius]|uniref:Uncharacterized protein n=1 Tax=Camelus dromedarius TaxID=9838 RepID=A0A5N4DWX9_CAMDR|nr:hypothetical protein Cadr_000009971 [Camelus dromedarius]
MRCPRQKPPTTNSQPLNLQKPRGPTSRLFMGSKTLNTFLCRLDQEGHLSPQQPPMVATLSTAPPSHRAAGYRRARPAPRLGGHPGGRPARPAADGAASREGGRACLPVTVTGVGGGLPRSWYSGGGGLGLHGGARGGRRGRGRPGRAADAFGAPELTAPAAARGKGRRPGAGVSGEMGWTRREGAARSRCPRPGGLREALSHARRRRRWRRRKSEAGATPFLTRLAIGLQPQLAQPLPAWDSSLLRRPKWGARSGSPAQPAGTIIPGQGGPSAPPAGRAEGLRHGGGPGGCLHQVRGPEETNLDPESPGPATDPQESL